MPKTNIRDWEYPGKDQSFFDSYDILQVMWRTIDKEFGSLANFMLKSDVNYFWDAQDEQDEQNAIENDIGLRTDTGDVSKYDGNVWVFQYRILSLPFVLDHDPSPDNWGMPLGFQWINETTGETFTNTNATFGAVVWLGNRGTTVSAVIEQQYLLAGPIKNMDYSNSLYSSKTNEYGEFFKRKSDSSITFNMNGVEFGTLDVLTVQETYWAISDLDVVKTDGLCDVEKHKRVLYLLRAMTHRPTSFCWVVGRLNPTLSFTEMVLDDTTYADALVVMGLTDYSDEQKEEIIYDYLRYISSHEELTDARKLNILNCFICAGYKAFDGNLELMDLDSGFVDANELPDCYVETCHEYVTDGQVLKLDGDAIIVDGNEFVCIND